MRKLYVVFYEITVGNRRFIQRSKPIKAFFKWGALLKFKRKIKHKKSFNRKIIGVQLFNDSGKRRTK